MENSNNTGKMLAVFTAVVFLFFIYEVTTNTSKVSQVNVPQKQPSEIVININEKKNNSPAPPAPVPPAPVPPAPVPPAPVPPAPVTPASAPPPPIPVPVTPASICNCRPIISSCGRCLPPPGQDPPPPSDCPNYNKNTCEKVENHNCRWDSSDCSLCAGYSDESNCNSAQQDCFWGCTTR